MALGFQHGAFQSPGFQQAIAATTGHSGGGSSGKHGRGRRKRYILNDSEYSLTREELQDALTTLLTETPKPETVTAKVKPQDREIVAAFPQYPDLRDMLLARKQIEAAQVLRQIAKKMADDEDEADVEALILWE